MPQVKEFVSNKFNEIELKIQEIIFLQNLEFKLEFFWYISFHHVKYLDKPIKCLEMRAKRKSVWKNNEIFLCIFTYI